MTRSKKVFAGFAIVFFLFLAYVVFDISTRTTFPGSAPEKPAQETQPLRDSLPADTAR